MIAVVKWLLGGVAVVLALGLALGLALFVATLGDYPVAALVTEDRALPSQEVAGIALHLQIVEGPAGAPTIVVLHGGPGGDFRSLLALGALSGTHRVVFYDQRGAGLSERVAADRLTLDGYLEELDAVLGLVSGEAPVVLIGHSWGAMLASAYLGTRPGRVERAVLIEPGYLDAEGQAAWEKARQELTSGLSYAVEAVLNGFRAAHVRGPDPQARDDFLIGRMVAAFASHPGNPYHCGQGYGAPNWRFGSLASARGLAMPEADLDRLAFGAEVDTPVLFLAGACNHWIGAALQARHAARFRAARVAVIPGAGHDVIWDNAEASLSAIRGFLDGGGERR